MYATLSYVHCLPLSQLFFFSSNTRRRLVPEILAENTEIVKRPGNMDHGVTLELGRADRHLLAVEQPNMEVTARSHDYRDQRY